MAFIYRGATLTPNKLDVVKAWLPQQHWAQTLGDVAERLGAFRFDDPDGEVGIETTLIRTGSGDVVQLPMTYRGAPLAGADDALMGTVEHSALGRRWVYDACADPVYASALVHAIVTGGHEAAQEYEDENGTRHALESPMTVSGSGVAGADYEPISAVDARTEGTVTVIDSALATIAVRRVLDTTAPAQPSTLRGTWPGSDEPTVLAYLM